MIRRVLMTADAAGGVWSYAVDLARGLRDRGAAVVLAVMGPAPRPPLPAELDIRYKPYKLEWMENPWPDVDRAGEWLLQLERETAPDVIHLNGYAHGSLPFLGPKIVVGHSCVLSWWEAVHGEAAPRDWDEYRARVSRGLNSAGLVIAPSGAMRRALTRHYGDVRVEVIPNGRDPKDFRAARKEPLIFAAGRLWDRAKNVFLLERIAPFISWPVCVAGEGAAFSNLNRLGVLGAEEMADWFSRAAIYAHPARYEPFGLGVLEAALSGCALVLGDIPSLRENWDGAALFASPEDPEEVGGRLRTLIDSESLRAKFQNASLERARDFPLDRMADAYLSAYERARSQFAATFKSSTSPEYSRPRSASGTRQTAEG